MPAPEHLSTVASTVKNFAKETEIVVCAGHNVMRFAAAFAGQTSSWTSWASQQISVQISHHHISKSGMAYWEALEHKPFKLPSEARSDQDIRKKSGNHLPDKLPPYLLSSSNLCLPNCLPSCRPANYLGPMGEWTQVHPVVLLIALDEWTQGDTLYPAAPTMFNVDIIIGSERCILHLSKFIRRYKAKLPQ